MTNASRHLPKRRAEVQVHEDVDEYMLVAPEQGTTYALNPTGRAIWELCDGTTTIEELIDAICQVFAVPRETALADVATILDQLTAADLVDWHGERF